MDKYKYVSQLVEEDYDELFQRLSLKVQFNGQEVRVDYSFRNNEKTVKSSPESKPYTTIFIEDFTCRIISAPEESKKKVREVYRNFMLERFAGTDYAEEAAAYDERRRQRLEAKSC